MPSSVQRTRVRKQPAERRAEIVAASAAIALADGLECVTLRRVAEALGVRPGLISHYFPAAEDLVAEAFGSAASAELEVLLSADRAGASPRQHLAAFLARTCGPAYDDVTRLWINARHLARYRPALRHRVLVQEGAWRGRLTALVEDGVACGEFRAAEPVVAAVHILVVLDGLGASGGRDTADLPEAVGRMAVTTAEQALGLPYGALDPPA
ncbi:TetR family transcriptional regulator [Streptomyces solincola]|uniref:TetR family transcriptional regulator n=1 Tax=Streptomyces solincola TaxID=2100817 RepID=A0A2S9PSG9_9ACTN|nr:TetR family transcriptional regulator C-terminal domain-containing protein [Streptomyces solincola]PRH77287.1 TetR family transcriptional regulator [Streptomyces solincola]